MNLVLLLLLVTSVITTFSAHIPVKGGRHPPDVTRPIEDKAITTNEKKEDAAISSELNLELSKSSSVGEAALGINDSTLKGQQSTLSEERTLKDITISADGQLERDVKKESSRSTNTHEENHHSKTLNGEKHLFKKTIENQNQDKVVVREQTSSLGDASFTSPKQVKLEDEHKIFITDEKNTHKILEDTLNDKKINQEEMSHLIHDSHTHHSFPDNIHHDKQKTVIVHDVIDHEKDSYQRHELNINIQGSDDKQKKVFINDFRGLNLDKQETQNKDISAPTPIPAFGENYDGINEKGEGAQISTSAPFPIEGGRSKVGEIGQENVEEKIGEVDQKKVDEKIDEVLEKKLEEKVEGGLEVATGSKVHNIHHDQKIVSELDTHKKDESHNEPHLHHEYSWKGHHEHDFRPEHDQKQLEVDVHKKDESHHGHHLEGHRGHDFHAEHDQKHLEVDIYKKDESHHEHHVEDHHFHDHPEHDEHDQKHLEVDVHKKDESHHGHHWEGHHGHDFHPVHDQKHLEDDSHHHFHHGHHPYHGHHWQHQHDHDFHLAKDQKHLEGDANKKDESHHQRYPYHEHHWEAHHGHDHPEHDRKLLQTDAPHHHFDHEHHPCHGHHWQHHHDHDFHQKHHHEPPSHKFVPKDLLKPIPPVVEEKEVIKTDSTRVIEDELGDKKETVFELETNTGSVKGEEEEKEVKLEVDSVGKEEGAAEGSTVVGVPAILKDIDVHYHVPEHDIHHEHHHHHCEEEKFHHVPHHHDHVAKPGIVKDEGVSKIDIAEEKLDKKIESAFKLSSEIGGVKKVQEEKVLIKEEGLSAGGIGIPLDVPKKDIHDDHHVKHNPVKGGRPHIPRPHEHDYHDYYDYGEHYPHEEKYHHHHHHSHYDNYHEDMGSPYHSHWTEI